MDNKPTVREIIAASIFIVFIGVFFVLNIVVPAPTVLKSERRLPARFPEVSINSVTTGAFMSGFENYVADRFVFRDTFRAIHAFQVFEVYRQTDKSGLYRCPNVGVGEFRRTNPTAFRQSSERIKKAADSLQGLDMNIYYSIVPDKSYFASRYMPGFDLGLALPILFEVLHEYKYIDVGIMSHPPILSGDSFYKTDLHWDQSKIEMTAFILSYHMGSFTGDFAVDYETETAGLWSGVYAGQLALPVEPDTMSYVQFPDLRVSYLNDRTLGFDEGPVYDLDRFSGVDPYDIFLRGPQPLVIIENDMAPERELYLFRDSFGSSLAPLLAQAYSKITVIDLRYINLAVIDMFIEYTPGSDVLFIFSSQIFNNPSIIQT